MTLHETNPAGRLWVFLNDTFAARQHTMLRDAWRDQHGDDPALYLPRLSHALGLPSEIRYKLRSVRDPVVPLDNVVRSIDSVELALGAALKLDPGAMGTVQSLRDKITPVDLVNLENCSHILARTTPTAAVPTTALARIRVLADEISLAVLEDDSLESDVREAIVRYASGLVRAVDLYKVRGAQALIDELDRFTSTAVRINLGKRTPPRMWERVKVVSVTVFTAAQVLVIPNELGAALDSYRQVLELPTETILPGQLIENDLV